MPSIYERVNPDGKKVYRVQIRVKGYPSESATFDRRTDAKEWGYRVEAEMRAGRYRSGPEARRRTFGEMIDRYVSDVLPTKGGSSRRSQSTQLEWWKAQLGDMLLLKVTPAEIAETRDLLLNSDSRRGRKRSPATVIRYMAALSHCYSIAVREWGWLDDSPMRKVSKPKEPSGRTRFLSDDERTRLLNACHESQNPYLYTIVVLALSTGMRRSEIMNLRWDQVDLNREVIRLLPEDTKNATSRAVPIAGPALIELRKLSESKVRSFSNLVFPAPNAIPGEERPIDIQSAWKAALQRAAITDFRFHDLRHSAASYLAMNGATLAEIAEILGHKTLQMVKRYAHLTEQHTSGVVKRMNAAVFGGS